MHFRMYACIYSPCIYLLCIYLLTKIRKDSETNDKMENEERYSNFIDNNNININNSNDNNTTLNSNKFDAYMNTTKRNLDGNGEVDNKKLDDRQIFTENIMNNNEIVNHNDENLRLVQEFYAKYVDNQDIVGTCPSENTRQKVKSNQSQLLIPNYHPLATRSNIGSIQAMDFAGTKLGDNLAGLGPGTGLSFLTASTSQPMSTSTPSSITDLPAFPFHSNLHSNHFPSLTSMGTPPPSFHDHVNINSSCNNENDVNNVNNIANIDISNSTRASSMLEIDNFDDLSFLGYGDSNYHESSDEDYEPPSDDGSEDESEMIKIKGIEDNSREGQKQEENEVGFHSQSESLERKLKKNQKEKDKDQKIMKKRKKVEENKVKLKGHGREIDNQTLYSVSSNANNSLYTFQSEGKSVNSSFPQTTSTPIGEENKRLRHEYRNLDADIECDSLSFLGYGCKDDTVSAGCNILDMDFEIDNEEDDEEYVQDNEQEIEEAEEEYLSDSDNEENDYGNQCKKRKDENDTTQQEREQEERENDLFSAENHKLEQITPEEIQSLREDLARWGWNDTDLDGSQNHQGDQDQNQNQQRNNIPLSRRMKNKDSIATSNNNAFFSKNRMTINDEKKSKINNDEMDLSWLLPSPSNEPFCSGLGGQSNASSLNLTPNEGVTGILLEVQKQQIQSRVNTHLQYLVQIQNLKDQLAAKEISMNAMTTTTNMTSQNEICYDSDKHNELSLCPDRGPKKHLTEGRKEEGSEAQVMTPAENAQVCQSLRRRIADSVALLRQLGDTSKVKEIWPDLNDDAGKDKRQRSKKRKLDTLNSNFDKSEVSKSGKSKVKKEENAVEKSEDNIQENGEQNTKYQDESLLLPTPISKTSVSTSSVSLNKVLQNSSNKKKIASCDYNMISKTSESDTIEDRKVYFMNNERGAAALRNSKEYLEEGYGIEMESRRGSSPSQTFHFKQGQREATEAQRSFSNHYTNKNSNKVSTKSRLTAKQRARVAYQMSGFYQLLLQSLLTAGIEAEEEVDATKEVEKEKEKEKEVQREEESSQEGTDEKQLMGKEIKKKKEDGEEEEPERTLLEEFQEFERKKAQEDVLTIRKENESCQARGHLSSQVHDSILRLRPKYLTKASAKACYDNAARWLGYLQVCRHESMMRLADSLERNKSKSIINSNNFNISFSETKKTPPPFFNFSGQSWSLFDIPGLAACDLLSRVILYWRSELKGPFSTATMMDMNGIKHKEKNRKHVHYVFDLDNYPDFNSIGNNLDENEKEILRVKYNMLQFENRKQEVDKALKLLLSDPQVDGIYNHKYDLSISNDQMPLFITQSTDATEPTLVHVVNRVQERGRERKRRNLNISSSSKEKRNGERKNGKKNDQHDGYTQSDNHEEEDTLQKERQKIQIQHRHQYQWKPTFFHNMRHTYWYRYGYSLLHDHEKAFTEAEERLLYRAIKYFGDAVTSNGEGESTCTRTKASRSKKRAKYGGGTSSSSNKDEPRGNENWIKIQEYFLPCHDVNSMINHYFARSMNYAPTNPFKKLRKLVEIKDYENAVWTREKETILVDLVEKHGTRYKKFKERGFFPGFTRIQLRSHYISLRQRWERIIQGEQRKKAEKKAREEKEKARREAKEKEKKEKNDKRGEKSPSTKKKRITAKEVKEVKRRQNIEEFKEFEKIRNQIALSQAQAQAQAQIQQNEKEKENGKVDLAVEGEKAGKRANLLNVKEVENEGGGKGEERKVEEIEIEIERDRERKRAGGEREGEAEGKREREREGEKEVDLEDRNVRKSTKWVELKAKETGVDLKEKEKNENQSMTMRTKEKTGKAKKTKAKETKKDGADETEKRPRGRPKKNSCTTNAETTATEKRPRGRPKKKPIAENQSIKTLNRWQSNEEERSSSVTSLRFQNTTNENDDASISNFDNYDCDVNYDGMDGPSSSNNDDDFFINNGEKEAVLQKRRSNSSSCPSSLQDSYNSNQVYGINAPGQQDKSGGGGIILNAHIPEDREDRRAEGGLKAKRATFGSRNVVYTEIMVREEIEVMEREEIESGDEAEAEHEIIESDEDN